VPSQYPTTRTGESGRPSTACGNERTGLPLLVESFPGLSAVVVQSFPKAEAGQIYEQFLSIDPNNSVLQTKVKELSAKH